MANKSVVLYQRTKIKKKWAYRKVAEVISKLACGEYYLSWYDGKRKRLDRVGSNPEAALAALEKNRLELAYVATGGEVKQSDNKRSLELAYVAAGGEIKQNEDHPIINGRKRPLPGTTKTAYPFARSRLGLAMRVWM